MHTHFTEFGNIRSLIIKHRPKHILELGALNGENTQNLLEIQPNLGFHLTVMSDDLSPEQVSSRDVTYLKGVSYKLIKALDDKSVDFVLLDTDHNYWTLHKELGELHPKLTYDSIVLVHDVDTFYYDTGIADGYGDGSSYPEDEIASVGSHNGSLGTGLLDFLAINKFAYRLIRWIPEGNGLAIIQKNPAEFGMNILKANKGRGKRQKGQLV